MIAFNEKTTVCPLGNPVITFSTFIPDIYLYQIYLTLLAFTNIIKILYMLNHITCHMYHGVIYQLSIPRKHEINSKTIIENIIFFFLTF